MQSQKPKRILQLLQDSDSSSDNDNIQSQPSIQSSDEECLRALDPHLCQQTQKQLKNNCGNKHAQDYLNTLKLSQFDDGDSENIIPNSTRNPLYKEIRKNKVMPSKFFKKNGQADKDELVRIIQSKQRSTALFISQNKKKLQIKKTINGLDIYFPYQPYNIQIDYMEKVIQAIKKGQNALLQSPTGTGKTLCMFSAILSWIYSEKLAGRHRKVIYLSRTHSQLAQIHKQLKKTCFRPTMSNLGSRDHFCIKPELNKIKGRQKMQACSKGVKLRMKDMKGQIKWTQMQSMQAKQTYEAMCTYYKQRTQTVDLGLTLFSNKIIQTEEFLNQGQNHKFCPYYYPFHMQPYCDLFLMPYNYILDEDLLPRFQKMISNSIIIFDEAHNVSEAACEGRSYELFESNIKGAISEIQKVLVHPRISILLRNVRDQSNEQLNQIFTFLQDLQQTIKQFLASIPFLEAPSIPNKLYQGEDKYQKMKLFDTQNIQIALYQLAMGVILQQGQKQVMKSKGKHFITLMKKMNDYVSHKCSIINEIIEKLKQTQDGIFHNVQKVSTFWTKIFNLLSNIQNKNLNFMQRQLNHYRLIVKVRVDQTQRDIYGNPIILDYSLQMKCLVPWLTFQNLVDLQPRSILFTSGTLSPLQSWEKELGLSIPIQFTNKHVISSDQIRLNVLRESIKGSILNFTFKNITSNQGNLYQDLIDTIYYISKVVPNGVLVVCPNFRTISELRFLLGKKQNRQKMGRVKQQIFQERGNDRYIQQFKVSAQKGAILYCVCRGRASEGIDFPDHFCRAVIIVGVPFPNTNDPILIEKKDHFTKLSRFSRANPDIQNVPVMSWQSWYFNNTIRAINQSLGRLIRHSKDYGMLFLLDDRYLEQRILSSLPMWAKLSLSYWKDFSEQRKQEILQFYSQNSGQPIKTYTGRARPAKKIEKVEIPSKNIQKIVISPIVKDKNKQARIISLQDWMSKCKK